MHDPRSGSEALRITGESTSRVGKLSEWMDSTYLSLEPTTVHGHRCFAYGAIRFTVGK